MVLQGQVFGLAQRELFRRGILRETGRGAKGVKLVSLAEGDKLLSIARIIETDAQQAAVNETPAS